jgi:hypothetical protein
MLKISTTIGKLQHLSSYARINQTILQIVNLPRILTLRVCARHTLRDAEGYARQGLYASSLRWETRLQDWTHQ